MMEDDGKPPTPPMPQYMYDEEYPYSPDAVLVVVAKISLAAWILLFISALLWAYVI